MGRVAVLLEPARPPLSDVEVVGTGHEPVTTTSVPTLDEAGGDGRRLRASAGAPVSSPPRPRILPLLRGFAGRCPHCGGRGIFAGIAELRDACPSCGFSFVREEGYWVGAMTVIFALILVVFGAWFVGGMLLTWPQVPWTGLLIGGLVLNGLLPVLGYGWSKAIWVGLDLTFTPARAEEFRRDEA